MHPVSSNLARQALRGFTLLELVVVVALLGILLSVALPSYQSYVRRSGAQTAAADLVALSLAMENLYQRQLVYPQPASNPTADTSSTLAYLASGTSASPWAPARADRFRYVVQASASGYTLKASGLAGGVNEGCELTLSSSNIRAVNGGAACGGISVW